MKNAYAARSRSAAAIAAIAAIWAAAPSIHAAQVTSNVNVVNTPNVNVVNTPSVRDADRPARQPFQAMSDTGGIYVPSNKRLVIEFVSGSCQSVPGVPPVIQLTTVAASTLATHQLLLANSHTDGSTIYSYFSQQTRLYADGGSLINFSNSYVMSCKVAISGSLIDP